jgi:limonene-1,2-epoxide hydrolase
MDEASQAVMAFREATKAAWPTGDATTLACFFSEDAEYRNCPLKPVRGREAILASLTEQMGIGGEVDADIINMISDGSIVMTERVDYWTSHERSIALRVMGTFEVRDGAITAWRDYFDANEFMSQMAHRD